MSRSCWNSIFLSFSSIGTNIQSIYWQHNCWEKSLVRTTIQSRARMLRDVPATCSRLTWTTCTENSRRNVQGGMSTANFDSDFRLTYHLNWIATYLIVIWNFELQKQCVLSQLNLGTTWRHWRSHLGEGREGSWLFICGLNKVALSAKLRLVSHRKPDDLTEVSSWCGRYLKRRCYNLRFHCTFEL